MMVNATLMRRVIEKITEFPELHNQDHFFSQTDCGTAACFAGWTCILSGHLPIDKSLVESHGYAVSPWAVAQEELGITDDQAMLLFSPCSKRLMLEGMVEDLIETGELKEYDDYHDYVH